MADTLIFLKLDDIRGECNLPEYRDQIEVESLSWRMSAKHTKAQNADKVEVQVDYDLVSITKFFDRATTALCLTAARRGPVTRRRKPFVTALITYADMVFDSGTNTSKCVPVMEIRLEEGFIERVRLSAADSGKAMAVTETVDLSFRTIKLSYYQAGEARSSRTRGLHFEGETASVTA